MAGNNLQSNSAPVTNVVRLPTAAQRKVRQRWSKVRKADRDALLHFPLTRTFSPWQRKALDAARILDGIEPHAAMTFASAIWRVLDDKQRLKVQMYLGLAQSQEGIQALEWTLFLQADNGDRSAIEWALKRLSRGEVE